MNYSFDENNEKKMKRKKILKQIFLLLIESVIMVVLAYGIVKFAFIKTTVVGDSMEQTLQNQDKILVNKFAYKIWKPKRFDVIVFKQNGREHSFYNIKRVVGLPGETVQIKNGVLYVNDKQVKELIRVDQMESGGIAEEPIVLDEQEYFVLGDNRNNSEDSRFANISCILTSDIVGKAWIRINTLNFVHSLNKAGTEIEPVETK